MKLLRADRVLTGRPGESFADGEVLVDGPRIAHVGVHGSAPEVPGTEIMNLSGCTLMPGMIDSHVHIGFDRKVDPVTRRSSESDAHLLLRMGENCRKLLSAGVTTARDLGGRDFIEVALRDAIEAGLAVGPHLVVATRPITHTGGHCWYMGGEADTEEDIRRVARENLRAGADLLKIMATGGNLTPVGAPPWRAQFTADQIKVAVDEAAMRGKTVAAHAHGAPGIANAVEAGVATIEHCSFAGPGGIGAPVKVDMGVIGRIAERGIYVCPTVSGVVWKIRDSMGGEWFDSWLSRLAVLRQSGVRMVAGTDAGFSMRGHENRMDDYVSGLEVLAAAGWDAAAIVEAATVLAAQACGLGEVAGSLDEGKRADLLAVRGNPLARLDDLRQVKLVMVSGRMVTQTGVDTVTSSGDLGLRIRRALPVLVSRGAGRGRSRAFFVCLVIRFWTRISRVVHTYAWPRCGSMQSERVPAYTKSMTVREEAHRLLDAVPEDRLTDAIDMLRQWASPEPGDVPRRRFRTTAIFDGEHDLGARAKQIVRDAWSGGEASTA